MELIRLPPDIRATGFDGECSLIDGRASGYGRVADVLRAPGRGQAPRCLRNRVTGIHDGNKGTNQDDASRSSRTAGHHYAFLHHSSLRSAQLVDKARRLPFADSSARGQKMLEKNDVAKRGGALRKR